MLSFGAPCFPASVGDTGAECGVSGYFSLADGRHLPVRDGFTIGRVAPADLVIDDSKASRRHARIVVDNGVVEIEDLGSSNGTLLNGKPVTRRVLRGGDQLQIGKTVFTFREGEVPGGGAAKAAGTGAGRGAAAVEDDNDLFGGDAPPAAPPAPRAAPAPVTPPPPRPEPVRSVPPVASSAPAAVVPPVAPPPPRPAVVEFADEVVEVRKPVAPAAPGKAAAAAAPGPVATKRQGVLQYSKQAGAGGLLGDDLAQVSGGKRAVLFLGVLALAVGLGWLVMKLVR